MSSVLSVPSRAPVVRTPAELREALSGASSVGLVPTMGYLHAGHAALIARARAENSVVVVSIFVNPLQFGAGEDLSRYPRDLERDRVIAAQAGADLIFHPDASTMYPDGFASTVRVGGVSERLEGASRPGHFDGVATVVLKLFNLVGADRAYFGEKDWQQLMVVRQMARDLNHKTRVLGHPTVRVPDGPAAGLAMSSRNSYLTPEQQARATVLSRALRAIQAAYRDGQREVAALLEAGHRVLATEHELHPDYLMLVDESLRPLASLPPASHPGVSDSEQRGDPGTGHTADMYRVLVAAQMFGVRLIDNLPLVADADPAVSTAVPGMPRP